jgi:hypothetical protein
MPSFVICTPSTGCSSSSSSEYSFDPQDMMSSDCVRPERYSPSDPPAARARGGKLPGDELWDQVSAVRDIFNFY